MQAAGEDANPSPRPLQPASPLPGGPANAAPYCRITHPARDHSLVASLGTDALYADALYQSDSSVSTSSHTPAQPVPDCAEAAASSTDVEAKQLAAEPPTVETNLAADKVSEQLEVLSTISAAAPIAAAQEAAVPNTKVSPALPSKAVTPFGFDAVQQATSGEPASPQPVATPEADCAEQPVLLPEAQHMMALPHAAMQETGNEVVAAALPAEAMSPAAGASRQSGSSASPMESSAPASALGEVEGAAPTCASPPIVARGAFPNISTPELSALSAHGLDAQFPLSISSKLPQPAGPGVEELAALESSLVTSTPEDMESPAAIEGEEEVGANFVGAGTGKACWISGS